MASVEVMKERARIAGRFNLSARRNPAHQALIAPGEDEADVLDRARKVAGGKPVIIVTEADGELDACLFNGGSN